MLIVLYVLALISMTGIPCAAVAAGMEDADIFKGWNAWGRYLFIQFWVGVALTVWAVA
jgi:hypothetical protein